ncbi:MAG: alkanesulfonate monooxygenase SsuD [Hyphomicrobiaceae bacterium]|jgi:alkanesulfonate monooxygenase SsuD/methylene tetrahydromethanopterin reductase-like flavin-dependent oxidoreductase (luciferase family)
MKLGLQMVFQNYGRRCPDSEVVANELRMALLADELGFDELWPVEHHFTDYAACPDNTQFLSYLAAKTTRIGLATGAMILPWNDPLRVAEKVIFLDHLSEGRAVFGMGRGLSRREYAGFGIDMEESRDRFDEASAMILTALETGFIEGDGHYYPQARTEIRPEPRGSFRGRTHSVAMSPDSALQAARLGVGMVVFSNKPDEAIAAEIDAYRKEYRQHHDGDPPLPRFCDFMVCSNDAAKASELAHRHIGAYFGEVMHHYELGGDHFKKSHAYKSYGDQARALGAAGMDGATNAYIAVQAAGTPEQILERLQRRRAVVGEFDLNICAYFGGLAADDAAESLRLFASEVVPALRAG